MNKSWIKFPDERGRGKEQKSFENTVGEKGEIAHNEQFLLLPHSVFYRFAELSAISSNSKLSSAKFLSLEKSKISRFGTRTKISLIHYTKQVIMKSVLSINPQNPCG